VNHVGKPSGVDRIEHAPDSGYFDGNRSDPFQSEEEIRVCRNEGDVAFDIVTIYAEKPTGTVPTPSSP
jgi:hypothetical protein